MKASALKKLDRVCLEKLDPKILEKISGILSKSKNYDVFRYMYLKQPEFRQKFLLKLQERHPDVHLAIQEYPGAIDVFLLRNKERPGGRRLQEEDGTGQEIDQVVQEQPED